MDFGSVQPDPRTDKHDHFSRSSGGINISPLNKTSHPIDAADETIYTPFLSFPSLLCQFLGLIIEL